MIEDCMYMSGIYDDDECDRVLEKVTLELN
jgi:hypothetical protein